MQVNIDMSIFLTCCPFAKFVFWVCSSLKFISTIVLPFILIENEDTLSCSRENDCLYEGKTLHYCINF